MFIFDCVFILFRISWWQSAGKELSPGFPLVLLLFHAVSFVCIPFPLGVWGRMWNSIVSVQERCLGQDVEFDCVSSREVSGAGCGIRVYKFLSRAYRGSRSLHCHLFYPGCSTKDIKSKRMSLV